MIKSETATVLKIFLILILIIILFSINIIFPSDCEINHTYSFINYVWVSSDSPVFYHYFYKNKNSFTVEIHEKSGSLASIIDGGILKSDTLTFTKSNGSTDIYEYENGIIRVFSINRNGKMSEFTPLERLENAD